jgi:hypothetical protein
MERKPPTPICKSFIVCRRVIQDQFTQEFLLLGPTLETVSLTFPTVANLSFFVRLTSMQGAYHLELQLQDLEGTLLWNHRFEPPLQAENPLSVHTVNLPHPGVYFTRPGKYDFVLLANGEEIVRDVFWAVLPNLPH